MFHVRNGRLPGRARAAAPEPRVKAGPRLEQVLAAGVAQRLRSRETLWKFRALYEVFTCFSPSFIQPNDFNSSDEWLKSLGYPENSLEVSRFQVVGPMAGPLSLLVVQGVSQGRRGCLPRPLHPVAAAQSWCSRSYSRAHLTTAPSRPPQEAPHLLAAWQLSTVVLVQDK